MKRYRLAQMDEIDAVDCPCGQSRRAFVALDNPTATLHMVDSSKDSRTNYHETMTEIYLVLEGEGVVELDGTPVAVKPLTAVFIEPGCRHRAVGNMRIANTAVPAFDPNDEWFDDE